MVLDSSSESSKAGSSGEVCTENTNMSDSRMESVNFVHDVNMLRKTVKAVYAQSPDVKAFNSESGDGPGNCRIQVLPVCWRHLLDFPKRRDKKAERDLSDAFSEEDECEYLEWDGEAFDDD